MKKILILMTGAVLFFLQANFVSAHEDRPKHTGPIDYSEARIVDHRVVGELLIIEVSGEPYQDFYLFSPYCNALISLDGKPIVTQDFQYIASAGDETDDKRRIEIYESKDYSCPKKVFESQDEGFYFSEMAWSKKNELTFTMSKDSVRKKMKLKKKGSSWKLIELSSSKTKKQEKKS